MEKTDFRCVFSFTTDLILAYSCVLKFQKKNIISIIIVLIQQYISMGMIIQVLFLFQYVCMIASFLISLRFINKVVFPDYMQNFYWYTLVGFFVVIPSLLGNYTDSNFSGIGHFVNNISVLFHFLFLSFFCINLLRDKKKGIFYFLQFVGMLILIFLLFRYNMFKRNRLLSAVANFGLVIFCILYFVKLFNNSPDINIKNEPSFWIVTGVLFCMSISIPVMIFQNHFYSILVTKGWVDFFRGIAMLCYGIMHLFFIKAFLCTSVHCKIRY